VIAPLALSAWTNGSLGSPIAGRHAGIRAPPGGHGDETTSTQATCALVP
jgi:hypothetical protein